MKTKMSDEVFTHKERHLRLAAAHLFAARTGRLPAEASENAIINHVVFIRRALNELPRYGESRPTAIIGSTFLE